MTDLDGMLNFGMAYREVEDILTERFDDLKLSFVPRGLNIFERKSDGVFVPNLYGGENRRLSSEAILSYGRFIRRIDEGLGDLQIDANRLRPLVDAYVNALKGKDDYDDSLVEFGAGYLRVHFLEIYILSQKRSSIYFLF